MREDLKRGTICICGVSPLEICPPPFVMTVRPQ